MILSEERKKRGEPIPPVGGVGSLLAKECFKALKDGNAERFSMCLEKLVQLEIEKREAFED